MHSVETNTRTTIQKFKKQRKNISWLLNYLFWNEHLKRLKSENFLGPKNKINSNTGIQIDAYIFINNTIVIDYTRKTIDEFQIRKHQNK